MNTHGHRQPALCSTPTNDTATHQSAAALAAALDPWRPDGPDLSAALTHLRDLAHDPSTPHTTAAALSIVLAEHVDRSGTGKPATTSTAGDLDASAPETIRAQAPVRHGRWVWPLGEDGEDGEEGYLSEGHDRRALAAINALGRADHGPRWAAPTEPAGPLSWLASPAPVAHRRWVLLHTTCGCSPDQHAEHLATDRQDPDWDGCPCPHWGLPPCEPDRFTWRYTHATAGTPGAVAVTEVAW